MKPRFIRFAIVLGFSLTFLATLIFCDVGSAQAGVPTQERLPPYTSQTLPPAPRLAGESVTLDLVGQVGGQVQDVEVEGDYAYLGVGPRVLVFNIADPANFMLVGQTDIFTSNVSAIDVDGEYAYVVAGNLHVLSIADPANPRPVSVLSGIGGADVHVDGDYVYWAEYSLLHVISVADPLAPAEVGTYGGYAMDGLHSSGNYVYVAGSSNLPGHEHEPGLVIISVADKSNPTEVGFHPTAGVPESVSVADGYLYVASTSTLAFMYFDGHLEVFSLSHPVNPTRIGSVTFTQLLQGSSYASDVHVAGEYAYVSAHYAGLVVVSIADKYAPRQVGHVDSPGRAYAVAVGNDYVFLADDGGGMRVVSVSNPVAPTESGRYVPGAAGGVNSVHVAGDHVYLGGGYAGLWSIDASDPKNPAGVGYVPLSGGFDSLDDIYVDGEYVYAADVLNGLKVFSVADPHNPSLVGRADTVMGGSSVYAAGGYAYMATRSDNIAKPKENPSGLYVFSVADPAAPQQVGVYETTGPAHTVFVKDTYAYVGVWPPATLQPGELRVVSVADPARPVSAGFFTSTLLKPYDVQVVDGKAYAATSMGLWPFSLTQPTQPEPLGYGVGEGARKVHVVGDYAYLAGGDVQVISIASPGTPVEVGDYSLGEAKDIYAVPKSATETYLYVANGAGGLVILKAMPLAFQVMPNQLDFMAEMGGANPPPQTLHIAQTSRPLTWTVTMSPTQPWLTVTPLSGTTPVILSVTVDTSGFANSTHFIGTYTATLTLRAGESIPGSPCTVPITLSMVGEIRTVYLPLVIRKSRG